MSDCFLAPESLQRAFQALAAKLIEYDPEWKGPITPEQSVKQILSVVEKNTTESGNAGDTISHLGNKTWV